jgi:hypothetical protein
MNRRVARLLTSLYPRTWRERYGEEFETHLEDDRGGLRTYANVIWSAFHERIFLSRGGNAMQHSHPIAFGNLMKEPTGFIPMTMSLAALAIVVGFLVTNGIVRQADEGIEAHLWQILMVGQLPMLLLFALKWLPRAPKQAICVLALQAGAALASMAPVLLLHL